MKKKQIGIGAALLALVVTGYFTYEHLTWVTTDNAQLQAHTIMLSSKVSGFVNEVNVVEGQTVKKGEVLIVIDSRDYENALQVAEGELASAKAALDEAQRNFSRLSALFKSNAVSQQQYDNANKTHEDAKARFQTATAHVSQRQLDLDNTKIVAPTDGFIAKKGVEIGQLASHGIPLLGFVENGERWITANFKETQISDIEIGREVEVEVDAIPGKTYRGKVESLSSATGATFTLLPPDNATGNFTKVVQRIPVKIMLENLMATDITKLRAGLSVFVKVRRH